MRKGVQVLLHQSKPLARIVEGNTRDQGSIGHSISTRGIRPAVRTHVFGYSQTSLSLDVHTHKIDTGDNPPVHQPARQIPFTLHAKVEEMVEDTIEQGVVHPPLILDKSLNLMALFVVCCAVCKDQCAPWSLLSVQTLSDCTRLHTVTDTQVYTKQGHDDIQQYQQIVTTTTSRYSCSKYTDTQPA